MHCTNTLNSLFIENDGFIYPCFATTSRLGPSLITHLGKPLHVSELTSETMLNWDGLVALRSSLAQGKWPAPCSKCRLLEEQGFSSTRSSQPDHEGGPRLEIIHLRLGNKCNLRCVMCGPNASNQWYNDYVAITDSQTFDVGNYSYQLEKKGKKYQLESDRFNFVEDEKLAEILALSSTNVREINFHGGEPMLSKAHHRLIDRLIDLRLSNQINLSYHTNGTVADTVMLDKLSNFRSVTIQLSLDGIKEINDAVRWPSKYDMIMNNIDLMREKTNNFSFNVVHTLHMLNAEHLPTFIQEMKEKGLEISINPVIDPGHISLGGLLSKQQTIRLKDKLGDSLSSVIDQSVGFGASDNKLIQNRNTFKRLWNHLSLKQSQDWSELFPLANTFMEEWQ